MAKKDSGEMNKEIHTIVTKLTHYIEESDQKINRLMMMHVHSAKSEAKAKPLKELKENQEDVNKRFNEFMVQFSQLGDLKKLEVSTITDMGFEALKAKIEGLKKEEDIVNKRFKELMNESEKEKKVIGKKHLNVAKRKIGQSDDRESVKRSKKEGIDVQRGLTDVIMEMYGFSLERAESIERSVRFQKVVNKALKNEQKEVIDLNEKGIDIDPLEDYISEIPVDCEGLEEDLDALRSQDAVKMEDKFKTLKAKIFSKDQQNVCKSLSKTQESDSCGEVHEILEVIRNWVLQLETDIICIMLDLRSLMSNNEQAVAKFEQFKSVLEGLKKRNGGLVPVVVYQIISLLEMPYSATMEDKTFDDTYRKGITCEGIQFDGVVYKLQEIISCLKFVLNTSGPTNTQTNRMEVLITTCENALKRSQEELRQIELKIKKPKDKLRELKMKKLAEQNRKMEYEGEDAEKGPAKDEAEKENKEKTG